MTQTAAPPTAGDRGSRPPRPAFDRAREDRVVAGVCGGLGARLGVDPVVLRLAFVPLGLAGGAGVVAYVLLWASAAERRSTGPDPHDVRPATTQQLVAIAMVTLGALLLLRASGLWLGDGIVWPVALAALGSAFVWARDTEASVFGLRRRHHAEDLSAERLDASLGAALAAAGPWRVLGGVGLILAGMVGFLAANDRLTDLFDVALATVVGLAGILLLFGPWLSRLVGQLGEERRERIRGEERAAVAAHLHDSVLQTLALIQRAADQPARTRALARRQERELRAWLYGDGFEPGATTGTIGEALARIATDVEDAFDVRVEAVVVGDAAVRGGASELVAAVREAVTNAARHSGAEDIDVYVESDVEARRLQATVRDRGTGFDPQGVAEDRHGIRHSIRGRLTRAGGGASLRSTPGEGTEWELWVPSGDDAQRIAHEPGGDHG